MDQAAVSSLPLAGALTALPVLSETYFSGMPTVPSPALRYYPEAVLRSDFRLASIYGKDGSPSLSDWATEVINRVDAIAASQSEKAAASDVMYRIVVLLSRAPDMSAFARWVDAAADEFGADAVTFALTALRDLGAKAK